MQKQLLFLLSVLSLMFVACGSKNIILDNPRDFPVVFTIDGADNFELAAGEMKKANIAAGNHKLTVKSADGQTLGDTTINIKESGIIHSGSSTYLVWRQLYGLQKDRSTLLNESWVEFDSIRAFGDIKILPANILYIEKNWDKGLDEELPESQTLYITKDYVVESKVFRAKEFVKTYKEMAKKSKEE